MYQIVMPLNATLKKRNMEKVLENSETPDTLGKLKRTLRKP